MCLLIVVILNGRIWSRDLGSVPALPQAQCLTVPDASSLPTSVSLSLNGDTFLFWGGVEAFKA